MNIIKIFINDLKNIGTNWVAAVLIGGLIILPSLYAWFNIGASWDPYGHTDRIPIGIVNEDKGALVRNKEVHVGDELIRTLKDNRSMDWKFVDQDKAMDKLEYGDYFAVIIIPENFSEKLGTVVSGHPEKAVMEYYVNEKNNAIAPKITEKGATVIVNQISSNFISTVNGIIFETFNDLGIEVEENLPDIKKFEDYLFTLEKSLPEIQDKLNQTETDANHTEDLIDQAQNLIPKAKESTSNGLTTIDNTTDFLVKAENRLNDLSPKIEEDLTNIQKKIADTNSFLSNIHSSSIDFNEENQLGDSLNKQINQSLESINTIRDALLDVQQQNGHSDEVENNPPEQIEDNNTNQATINNAIKELEDMENQLKAMQEQANALNTSLEDKKAEVDMIFSSLKEQSETVNERVDAFVKEYKENIEPTVKAEVKSAKETLNQAKDILVGIQSTIPEVENMLNRTEENLKDGEDTLQHVLGEFPYVNDKVNELADRIRTIQKDTDINEIIQLLQNDPEAEKGFFAEPVVLNENKLFPIQNYGTGMTPFYTVLSIWVGGLLLISLLSTDIHGTQAGNYSGRQVYFGRLFTYLTIGFLQTIIITMGDLFILKVNVSNPIMFVLFGLLCSAVFITIIYTAVSVLGDVGKALAIVLLVLQIAGSGGTYPVVLLPEFFQTISTFLPFTYAIDLLREAVGGIVWGRVSRDVTLLVIFGSIALVLGGLLKNAIGKLTHKLGEKARESGLFH